jgi:tetratricopeptide (TPR) repeat protein
LKIRTDIFWVAILLFFAACTSTRRIAPSPTPAGATPLAEFTLTPPEGEPTATHYYLQGIRASVIYDDTLHAVGAFNRALEYDSLHAPSLYELAGLHFPDEPEKALAYSQKANALEPDNLWFKQQLGQISIFTGRYEEARLIFDEIVRVAPNDPNNVRYLAALYDETGAPEKALAVLDSGEMRFGIIERLADYKRHLLLRTGQVDRAIDEALALVRNSPYESRHFIVLGSLYDAAERDSLTVDAYEQALALDPENVDALTALSNFYLSRNEGSRFFAVTRRLFDSEAFPREKKVAYFRQMIGSELFYRQDSSALSALAGTLRRNYPRDYEITRLYARYQINSGQLDSALTTYKNALTDTSGVAHYRTIIEMESYLERPDSAARYTDLALRHHPGEMDLYLSKGYGLHHMKAYDEAIATFAEAYPHAADDSVRSVLYASMGQSAEAADSTGRKSLGYFERAVRLDPENLNAVFLYVNALIDRDKKPEKAFRRIDNDSLRSLILGVVGDMYYSRDSVAGTARAYAFYERALADNPDNISVLNNYAYFLSLDGRDLDRALAMSSRVMELEPGNPTFIDTYGWVLYKLGRYEEAKTALRQAVALDAEGSSELLIHYGDVLYELKEYYMASVYWRKAQEAGHDPAEIERRLKKIEGK